MTDSASTTSSSTPTVRNWMRWLYPILAITGIAVGLFIIGAGIYLIFLQSGSYGSTTRAEMSAAQMKDCCESMMKDMKDMKMPMESMPSMSPMPGMPSMPNMPAPTPSR
jgi:hypothetical protein